MDIISLHCNFYRTPVNNTAARSTGLSNHKPYLPIRILESSAILSEIFYLVIPKILWNIVKLDFSDTISKTTGKFRLSNCN